MRIEELKEISADVMVLYHGTSRASAEALIANGWSPSQGRMGGNMGQSRYLYLTTEPENARWFANEKGEDTVMKVVVNKADLRPDPEDGIGETVEEELAIAAKNRLPANLVLTKPVPASAFSVI